MEKEGIGEVADQVVGCVAPPYTYNNIKNLTYHKYSLILPVKFLNTSLLSGYLNG